MNSVWVWGRCKNSLLPESRVDAEGVAPYPVQIDFPNANPISVFAGARSAGVVCGDGSLWTWGAGLWGRLGHGSADGVTSPKRVAGDLALEVTVGASLGETHGVAVTASGRLYGWGSGSKGALGDGNVGPHIHSSPVHIPLPDRVMAAHAGSSSTLCILSSGAALLFGEVPSFPSKAILGGPTPLRIASSAAIVFASLGWFDGGLVDESGTAWTFGCGISGNLGNGGRGGVAIKSPHAVALPEAIRAVACTRHIPSVPATASKADGAEGLHTAFVAASGAVYTAGTAHKGVLLNTLTKGLNVGKGYDALTPYHVGSSAADTRGASTGYFVGTPVLSAASSALHFGFVTAKGDLFTSGCGSGGRCGVRAYMEGLHGGRSRMKTYLPAPTPVVGLGATAGKPVLMADAGGAHMIALVGPPGHTKLKGTEIDS